VRRHGQRDSTVITLFKDGLVTPPFELAGISVKTSQLDDAPIFETTLLFKNPTEEWVGHWALQACNKAVTGPAKLDADVLIRGCIAFDLAVSSKEFVVGRADGIYLVLQRCSDASRLSTVSAISLSAVLLVDGKSVRATLGEDESLLKVPFTPTVASLGGATNKNVKLQVVELNASYEVLKGSRPVVLEWSKRNSIFDISLRLPPKTPYVEQLGCGSISKRSKSVVCEFRAVASDVEGRVLTDGPEIELSKSLGNVKFAAGSSATFPLKVKPGQPETFAYTFELAGVRTNTENVNQAFEIVFVYETDGEPREKGVFTGEFVVEPDFGITPDWGRAILFALGGLLTALLILIIARWFTARIQIPESGLLWVATVELPQCDAESVRSALLSPHAAASSLPLSPSPFGVRSLESNGPLNTTGSSLQARAGWRFLSELGYVQVSSASGCVVGSGGVMPTKRSGRIPLSLTKEWWVVSNWQGDGTAESVEDLASQIVGSSGRLVYITAGSESSRTFLEDLARRIESTWSGSVDSFATAIWKKKSKLIDKSTPPTPPLPEI